MRTQFALVLASYALVTGCGSDGGGPSDPPDPTWLLASAPFAPSYGTSPVSGLDPGARFAGGIAYGSDPQQVMDVFLPAAGAPTPAVIYVHGGGFVDGSRTDAYQGGGDEVRASLALGVAFVGVDYRLLAEVGVETVGVKKCLHDTRRALQFLRHHAAALNIDPARIAIYGISAGAGTSAWIALHPEMAQPDNDDLIARQSTRVRAAAPLSTQGTYDILRWAPDVFGPEYGFVTNDLLLSIGAAVDLLLRFYGLPQGLHDDTTQLLATLQGPSYAAYRADLDLFALASADDPPLYVSTPGPDVSPLGDGFDVLHHPLHAKSLHEHAVAAGIAGTVAQVPAYDLTTAGDVASFLLSKL